MATERNTAAPDSGRLNFRWPVFATPDHFENFFFGVWHPTRPLDVGVDDPPAGVHLSSVQGSNWLLLSNRSPLHSNHPSLLHRSSDGKQNVAFRGYLVEPALHSYSPPDAIIKYWSGSAKRRHNGVFSAASVDVADNSVTLITDAFGFGPLYYRECNGYLLFSTNPRFLAIAGDEPDKLAWRCWIQSGYIQSDRSLTRDVRRVPAGSAVIASREGIVERPWFDFDSLPDGARSIDDHAFEEVEEQFQTSMSRCLSLRDAKPILPLSSGHDSRRILASLLSKTVNFESFTVRVQQKEFRDLDATFAAAMAADFGFPHTVVELGEPGEYVADNTNRRILTDTESSWHAWVFSMLRAFPEEPGLVFDGILGDILGNPGFRMPGMYESTEKDLDLILRNVITDDYNSVLAPSRWPTAIDVRNDIRQYLQPFMHRRNMAEFAFILLRQRRNTALWSQQIMPAGHVVVCPYLDLDYISLLLEFNPKEKHDAVFQRQCLHRFWPEFARYPGNRDIPPDMSSGDPSMVMKRDVECFNQLYRGIVEANRFGELMHLLTLRRKLVLMASRLQEDSTMRWSWGVNRLLELQAREATRVPCWEQA